MLQKLKILTDASYTKEELVKYFKVRHVRQPLLSDNL